MSPPSAVPDEFSEKQPDTGVHDPIERVEARIRTGNTKLDGIREDFNKHAAADEKSFAAVQGELTRGQGAITLLGQQHASMLGEIGSLKGTVGEVSGKVSTLLTLQQQSTTAQLELAASSRKDKEAANATTEKVALAKTEASMKITKTVISAILAVALALVAGLVGHSVGAGSAPAATSGSKP
jgi:hypothetical protein